MNPLMQFPDRLTVLLEPTGDCNLRCKHCYHAKTEYKADRMSLKTLDKFLAACAPYYKYIYIIWHGGEPLLMGTEFYREAYRKIGEYASRYKTEFSFSIQTNGTLLTPELTDLFSQTKTGISVSYDGPYNGVLRQETEKTENALRMLQENQIGFSCLSTVSSKNVNHLIGLYKYFKNIGVSVKFNPILPDGAAADSRFLIDGVTWADNFIKLFKHWFFDTDCNIYMQSCMDILKRYLGLMHRGCLSGACMFRYIAVDAVGNVYPCGRMITDRYKLTNVYETDDIRQAFLSETYSEILNKNKERADKCKQCKWFTRCHSGCNASASLAGDIANKFQFECYFNLRVFTCLEELLENYDQKQVNINKYALEILKKRRNTAESV